MGFLYRGIKKRNALHKLECRNIRILILSSFNLTIDNTVHATRKQVVMAVKDHTQSFPKTLPNILVESMFCLNDSVVVFKGVIYLHATIKRFTW